MAHVQGACPTQAARSERVAPSQNTAALLRALLSQCCACVGHTATHKRLRNTHIHFSDHKFYFFPFQTLSHFPSSSSSLLSPRALPLLLFCKLRPLSFSVFVFSSSSPHFPSPRRPPLPLPPSALPCIIKLSDFSFSSSISRSSSSLPLFFLVLFISSSFML